MSQVTRPTNMAIAFVNAAVPKLLKQGQKAVWTARRVQVNAEREVGIVREINEINITHTPAHETDKRLRAMGFDFGVRA